MNTKRTLKQKNRLSFFTFWSLVILSNVSLLSCSQYRLSPEEVVADHLSYVYPDGRPSIQNISTMANCKGPDGTYITITESLGEEDYLFFHQNFFYKENFSAIIKDATTAYSINDTFSVLDTLPAVAVTMMKSHEFHKIALQLDRWFMGFEMAEDTVYFSIPSTHLMAKDQWEQPHHLFFDQKTGQCIGFQLQNPLDQTEKIRIYYKDWQKQGDLFLFDKVDIIQGSDKLYSFDFEEIQLNKTDFKVLNQSL